MLDEKDAIICFYQHNITSNTYACSPFNIPEVEIHFVARDLLELCQCNSELLSLRLREPCDNLKFQEK